MEPEILGKANLIYGLYRRCALESALPKLGVLSSWGGDIHFVYAFLCRRDFTFDDGVFFHKRVDTMRSASTRAWPRRYVYPVRKTGEYLLGYVRAAAGTPYVGRTRAWIALRVVVDWLYWLVTLIPSAVTRTFSSLARRGRTPVGRTGGGS
jgi:hypothetical protein